VGVYIRSCTAFQYLILHFFVVVVKGRKEGILFALFCKLIEDV